MIIPTPEFNPMFADDGIPFRTKMLGYIEQEFSDILGDHQRFLYSEDAQGWLAHQIGSALSHTQIQKAA